MADVPLVRLDGRDKQRPGRSRFITERNFERGSGVFVANKNVDRELVAELREGVNPMRVLPTVLPN